MGERGGKEGEGKEDPEPGQDVKGQVMEKLGDLNISEKIILALFHCGCNAHFKHSVMLP